MKNDEILNEVQEIAIDVGFDLVGVAEIASSDYLLAMTGVREKLDEWIADGYHADMKWMANPESLEKRKDVLKVMPDAKSVICVAMNYYVGEDEERKNKSCGQIARYACGRDYHKIFDKKLKLFARRLKEEILRFSQNDKGEELKFRCYSDTCPVLERMWAEKAGLGFVGKNTNLITKYGSWVLLGEIITNIEIPTFNFKLLTLNSCGSCRRCLDACPTGALCAPYTVDARKCISYLTIEHKGEIPMELREKMGNRIFGCDACQEVCPFNIGRQTEEINFKKAQNSLINNYHFYRYSGKSDNNREENIANKDKGNKDMGIIAGPIRDLKEILSIKTDEEFLEKFAGSPVMRAKRRGLVRNACIAAGNANDKSLLPYLKDCAKDNDPIISETAKWAIGRIENGV